MLITLSLQQWALKFINYKLLYQASALNFFTNLYISLYTFVLKHIGNIMASIYYNIINPLVYSNY